MMVERNPVSTRLFFELALLVPDNLSLLVTYFMQAGLGNLLSCPLNDLSRSADHFSHLP